MQTSLTNSIFPYVFSPVFPCESDIDDQYIWIPAQHAVSFE